MPVIRKTNREENLGDHPYDLMIDSKEAFPMFEIAGVENELISLVV